MIDGQESDLELIDDAPRQDWAPEPLRWDDETGGIVDAEDVMVIFNGALGKRDSKRAIACVNACAGIPTELLTGRGKPEYISCYDCGTEGYYIKVHGESTTEDINPNP